jgi:hypothetical protein
MKLITQRKQSLKLSRIYDGTRVRILTRSETTTRPYVAKRRDFTKESVRHQRVITVLLKGFVWSQT